MINFRLSTKTFTRGEKRAFNELYRITKGFKTVPKSRNPRDVARFRQLAMDVDDLLRTGNTGKFDKEGAKTLLNNLGLKEGAGQVDKLVEKYGNKEAIDRLIRLDPVKRFKDYPKMGKKLTKAEKKIIKESRKSTKGLKEYEPSSATLDSLAKDRIKKSAKDNNIRVNIVSNPLVEEQGAFFYKGKGGVKRRIEDKELLKYFKDNKIGSNSINFKGGDIVPLKRTRTDGQIFAPPSMNNSAMLGHELGHALEPTKFSERVIKSRYGYKFDPVKRTTASRKIKKLNKLNEQLTTLASESSATAKSIANQNKVAKDAIRDGLVGKREIKSWKNKSEQVLDKARQSYINSGLYDLNKLRPIK